MRAYAADHSVAANGNPGRGFSDITIRLAAGRDATGKTHAIDSGNSRRVSSVRNHLPPDMH